MRLLIVDQADFLGGAEFFTVDLLRTMPREEFHVHLATGENCAYKDLIKNLDHLTVLPIDLPKLSVSPVLALQRFSQQVRMLVKIIKEHNISFIHSNSIRAHIVCSLASFLTRTPLVWFLHDCTFPPKLLRIFGRVPKKIVVATDFVANEMRKHIPQKFHWKFVKIPNGIDLTALEEKTKTPLDLRSELGLNKDIFLIGIVGRIDWWKGQREFIKAAAKVNAAMPQTRFSIIGAPSSYDQKTQQYFEEIKELVRSLNLGKEVIFLGFRNDVERVINALDVLVHASIEPEPFGRVILQGMALGKPVIASSLGGSSELLEHEKSGLLIDPRDTDALSRAILFLLENGRKRAAFGQAARHRVRREFQLADVVQKITSIYRECDFH